MGHLPLLGARDPCNPQDPSLCWPIQPVQGELSIWPFAEGTGPVTSPCDLTRRRHTCRCSAGERSPESMAGRAESWRANSCPIPEPLLLEALRLGTPCF